MDQPRHQVAICTRMLVDSGIMGYSGHISQRVDPGDRFLVQPVDDVRADLLPERLLVVDLEGNVLEGDGRPPSEVAIHAEVYRARSDVGAVAHFHHDPSTVFTTVEGRPWIPLKNHASRWAPRVAVHPDPSHIAAPEQGRALVETLGDAYAVLLRAHGEVLVAEDIPSLFADVVHFVENTQTLLQASMLGPVIPLSPDEVKRFLDTFRRDRHARKLWDYHTSVSAHRGAVPQDWLLSHA